jgi:hypothetical protein
MGKLQKISIAERGYRHACTAKQSPKAKKQPQNKKGQPYGPAPFD